MQLPQLGFLTAECAVAAAMVLALVRIKPYAGLGPLFVTMGAWQFLQTLLANSFYVPLTGELSVSPGSTALFAGNLFAVLVVYVRVGPRRARELIAGLVAANLSLTVWALVLGWHLTQPETVNLLGVPVEVFSLNARLTLVGTLVTALDVILVAIVWEVLGRAVPTALAARSIGTLGLVLAADTLLFATGAFAGTELWLPILVSGLVGKTFCAVLYGLIFGLWLRAEGVHYARVVPDGPVYGLFSSVEPASPKGHAELRDAETGLYTADFFRDVLPAEVAKAVRGERDAVFVLFDLDHFRTYARMYGPEARRRVIMEMGMLLLSEIGPTDLAVRYGPDQFGLFLYNGGVARGHAVATGVRRRLRAAMKGSQPPMPGELTLTVGVAAVGGDETDARALTFAAEARVHSGKQEGRDRVVAHGGEARKRATPL
ncbi:MAG: diguanylate cyclase [Deltaproteobacteria bacterium]|nr:MAG: diguanylate cyclase [Deltaproteobacteria bacterium]